MQLSPPFTSFGNWKDKYFERRSKWNSALPLPRVEGVDPCSRPSLPRTWRQNIGNLSLKFHEYHIVTAYTQLEAPQHA